METTSRFADFPAVPMYLTLMELADMGIGEAAKFHAILRRKDGALTACLAAICGCLAVAHLQQGQH